MVALLSNDIWFPHVDKARDGLVAVGGDLRPERLLFGYAQGIFPWYDEHSPILWWSPDPRCILSLDKYYVSRRLLRIIHNGPLRCTFNQAFDLVIKNCANISRPRQGGTWLLPEMQEAYKILHLLGFAHSVECWHHDVLVGGVYGVALGKAFFGESMFHHVSDASKIALVHLLKILTKNNFTLFDCQQETPHIMRMGAHCIARTDFNMLLNKALVTCGIDVFDFATYNGRITYHSAEK